MHKEKDFGLLSFQSSEEQRKQRWRSTVQHVGKWLLAGLVLAIYVYSFGNIELGDSTPHLEPICPQENPWQPNSNQRIPLTPSKEVLAKLLSGAVQVNTTGYDDSPPVSDDPQRWEVIFSPFREYLYSAFPEVHFSPSINLERVNQHGLLYTWKGSQNHLKPIIFTAHQDVVPVDPDTLDRWDYGPFSGHIDLEKGLIYGRGASDDKGKFSIRLAILIRAD